MVSCLLLPTFGTLSLPLYFQLPSTFLPLKGRSITTLGTRWHDFFITLFRCFIKLFYSFYYTSFPLFKGCRLEKGSLCPFCVPIHKKKEKKKCLKCKLKELKLSNVANVVDDLALDDAVGRDAPLSVESQFPVDSQSVFNPDLDF